MISKRKLFRKLVDIADEIDIWVGKTFNKHPKQATLEAVQNRTTRKNFDETIGKALGTKTAHSKHKVHDPEVAQLMHGTASVYVRMNEEEFIENYCKYAPNNKSPEKMTARAKELFKRALEKEHKLH